MKEGSGDDPEADTANGTDTSDEQSGDLDDDRSSSDAQPDTTSGGEGTTGVDGSGDRNNRFAEMLKILIGRLPLAGAVTILVLGGVLLEKRSTA